MQLDKDDLAMIWMSLLIEQKNYLAGSHMWFRFDHLIRRIERKLGMKERPVLKEVNNENQH